MKQHVFRTQSYVDSSIPDAHIDPNDAAFQIANGVVPRTNFMELPAWQKDNPANEKARMMREQGIKPGTPAWFALWGGSSQ